MSEEDGRVAPALAAPFDPKEVQWKAQVVSGNRALAVAYIDARAVQDRLDDVLGVMGWQDSYDVLPDGAVVCRLKVRLGTDWITKVDVGGQSEQPDEGDRRKAAFSDALKRAAVKFGIGRYLYRLDPVWVDYDAKKKQLARVPDLPDWALPGKAPVTRTAPAQQQRPANGLKELADGAAFEAWLHEQDAAFVKDGLVAKPGQLVKRVIEEVQKLGGGAGRVEAIVRWAPPFDHEIALVRQFRKTAEEARERRNPKRPITSEEYGQLADLMKQKAATAQRVKQALGLPGAQRLDQLTLEQWRAAMKRLEEEPAPAEKGGRR